MPRRNPGTVAPNVTGFKIDADGSLTADPELDRHFPVGTFATQTLIARTAGSCSPSWPRSKGRPGQHPRPIPDQGGRHPGTVAPGGNGERRHRTRLLLGQPLTRTLNIVYSGFTSSGQVGVVHLRRDRADDLRRRPSADQGRAPCWSVVIPTAGCCTWRTRRPTRSALSRWPTRSTRSRSRTSPLGGPLDRDGGRAADRTSSRSPSTRRAVPVRITQATDLRSRGKQLHTLTVAAGRDADERTPPVVFSLTDVPAMLHRPPGRHPRAAGADRSRHPISGTTSTGRRSRCGYRRRSGWFGRRGSPPRPR